MGRRLISTTVYLEPEQLAQLHEISEATEVPMAALIRRGVKLILERYGSVPNVLSDSMPDPLRDNLTRAPRLPIGKSR